MNDWFRNSLSLWQWALLALVPPAIIALYFLKLKRQPLEVPSTYLWQRSIEDLHVNSLWQRLRRNLLLFLQLFLVGLAILALLRPGWEGNRLTGQRFVLLVDNSASMSASDVGGASTRLDEAKRLAEGVIDQMDAGMSAMIISFADRPKVVQEFTSNRRLLRERINSIQPTAQGTDLADALELASGLVGARRPAATIRNDDEAAAESPPATAYIFSDGRFEEANSVTLEHLTPVYVPVGSFGAANLAITAVSTRRNEERPEQRQVFVRVANYTAQPRKVVVELTLDGEFVDATEIEVPADEMTGTVFPLSAGTVGGLAARLRYTFDGASHDALRQDDVGYAALNDTGTGRVLVVTPGDTPLEAAFRTARAKRLARVDFAPPATLESAAYRQEVESGVFDLIVYDQCVPTEMPRANTLFVGRLPPSPEWRRSEDASVQRSGGEQQAATTNVIRPQIVDWDHASPLLTHVDLGDVALADSLLVAPPAGGSVLVESTAGPIAAIGPRGNFQDVVLGFEIVGRNADGTLTANTNWPVRASFPTFWLNSLEYLAAGGEEQESATIRPGSMVKLRAREGVEALAVVRPDGSETKVRRSASGGYDFAATDAPGIYQVRQGDTVTERFAVDLFDPAESKVAVRPTQDPGNKTLRPADIRIGDVDIAAATDRTPARQEAWKLLLACALFLLVLEWYIYNRRVYL